jgi:hypothetical protein
MRPTPPRRPRRPSNSRSTGTSPTTASTRPASSTAHAPARGAPNGGRHGPAAGRPAIPGGRLERRPGRRHRQAGPRPLEAVAGGRARPRAAPRLVAPPAQSQSGRHHRHPQRRDRSRRRLLPPRRPRPCRTRAAPWRPSLVGRGRDALGWRPRLLGPPGRPHRQLSQPYRPRHRHPRRRRNRAPTSQPPTRRHLPVGRGGTPHRSTDAGALGPTAPTTAERCSPKHASGPRSRAEARGRV